jgi:hypothetical protein
LVRPAPTVGAAQRRLWFLDVLKVRPRPNANSLGPIRVPTMMRVKIALVVRRFARARPNEPSGQPTDPRPAPRQRPASPHWALT